VTWRLDDHRLDPSKAVVPHHASQGIMCGSDILISCRIL
jgi:hypothetical protein